MGFMLGRNLVFCYPHRAGVGYMAKSSVANAILKVVHDYEANWETKLPGGDKQIELLEQDSKLFNMRYLIRPHIVMY